MTMTVPMRVESRDVFMSAPPNCIGEERGCSGAIIEEKKLIKTALKQNRFNKEIKCAPFLCTHMLDLSPFPLKFSVFRCENGRLLIIYMIFKGYFIWLKNNQVKSKCVILSVSDDYFQLINGVIHRICGKQIVLLSSQ